MIGQEILEEKLNTLTLSNLPHTLMLLGDSGCGKRTYLAQISEKLRVPIVDITNSISLETITDIQTSSTVAIYFIDCNKITEKQQNALLKLLEEPVNNVYLVLLCENKSYLLETVINRCVIWEFKPYTRRVLSHFTEDDNLLYICTTPGQIIKYKDEPINEMINLCRNIFGSIGRACYANVLVLPDKLSYKDEEGYNADLFFRLLNEVCAKECIKFYKLTNQLLNDSKIPNIDKKKLFENFLFKLKELYEN